MKSNVVAAREKVCASRPRGIYRSEMGQPSLSEALL